MGQLFDHLQNLHGEEAGQRSVTLTFAGDRSLAFVGDERRVAQAVSNLLGNALRAVDAHGTVSVSALAPDAQTTVIEVTDDGPGIAPERLDTLFHRYAQGDRAGGASLGSSIARGIAEGHRGSLSATNQLGDGACFRLTLPTDLRLAGG